MANKKTITVEVTYARGNVKGQKGCGMADIVIDESVRLYGTRYPSLPHPEVYDITFKMGDWAEYDSFNLSYIGKITKITTKQVWITEHYGNINDEHAKTHRLDLADFEWRNYNFNLASTRERNAAISQCI